MSFSLDASVGVDLGVGGVVKDSSARPFDLVAGAFVQGELRGTRFLGIEKLHDLYAYDVAFITDVDPSALQLGTLGLPACLTLHAAGKQPRVVQGLVSSIESVGRLQAGRAAGRRLYRLRISPRAWILTQRGRPRVFQDHSPRAIVSRILDLAQVPYEWRTSSADKVWPFAYQRDETDFELIQRVLATAGISFCFEHAHGLLETLMPGASAFGALAVNPMDLGADALGGGIAGAALSGAAGVLASATKIVFFDKPGVTPAVSDDNAVDEAIAGVAGAALGAVASGLGSAVGGALGDVGIDLSMALGPKADPIPYEDGIASVDGREHIKRLALRRNVRSKRVVVHEHLLTAQLDNMTAVESGYAEMSLSASIDAGMSAVSSLAKGNVMGALGGMVSGSFDATMAAPLPSADELTFEEHSQDPSMLDARWTVDLVTQEPAQRALEQLRHDAIEAEGATNSRRIAPGYRFKLQDHPIPECNREYLATSVKCEGIDPELAETDTVEWVFRAEFRAVPAVYRVRPPKPRPAPRLGIEVATVIGPPGSPIYVDDCNRVQVQFAWAGQSVIPSDGEDDIYGLVDNTCFLPVMTPWAGPGYGMQQPPRVGMQVLVGFLGGRGETPVVLGCVQTEWNKRPFASGHVVGIRTHSEPGGMHYNELSFDDLEGREKITLHAAKDLHATIRGKVDTDIGASRTVTVGTFAHEKVSRDYTLDVGGSGALNFAGSMSISATSYTMRVDDLGDASGSRRTSVRGSWNAEIQGDDARTVYGGSSLSVRGQSSRLIEGDASDRVRGRADATVEGGSFRTVGTAAQDADDSTYVHGTFGVETTDEMRFVAKKRILLSVGATSIELTADTLHVLAKNIAAAGSTQTIIGGAGARLALDGKARVAGDAVRLVTSQSQVEVSDAIKLTASSIKMASGSGDSASDSASNSATAPTHDLKISLLDAYEQPYDSKTYEAIGAGFYLKGTTDAQGTLTLTVPTALTVVRVEVWTDTYPKGASDVFVFDVGTLEGPDTVKGALQRLSHLGYYSGPIVDAWNDETRAALREFQGRWTDTALDPTGENDADTQAALKKAHGS